MDMFLKFKFNTSTLLGVKRALYNTSASLEFLGLVILMTSDTRFCIVMYVCTYLHNKMRFYPPKQYIPLEGIRIYMSMFNINSSSTL